MILLPLDNPSQADLVEKGVSIFREALFPSLSSTQVEDLYHRLITARTEFNQLFFHQFDCYLEDEWNEYVEGETWFDYRIRSLKTKDEFPPLASDIYLNHQDEGGVWHLGDYQTSIVKLTSFESLAAFLETHRYAGQAYPN
jgi:hypothetical protein